MSNLRLPQLFRVLALCSAIFVLPLLHAQDENHRGRKYTPPPATARVSVTVVKATNSKPVENAAVVFHMIGEKDKGNMELKTNEEGKAVIEVIPIGDTVRLQVIADGFRTYGEDYKVDTDTKDIVVKLQRPGKQYSTYEHPNDNAQPDSGGDSTPKTTANPQTRPKP